MPDYEVWNNPLVGRYAGKAMAALWSPQRKFSTWRRSWVALAEAQRELGLDRQEATGKRQEEEGTSGERIRESQIEAMRACVDTIDFDRAAEYEKKFRHDVMAHIHAFGDDCPEAREIIHLGATSCFVTDNTDLILLREGLILIRDLLVGVIDSLARFAAQYAELPTLGFTHFQPAQLVTVGKRAALWCYDLVLDLAELEHRLDSLKFRGVKGTTGTQASFLSLFNGDHEKVKRLDTLVAEKMGFDCSYPVTGQTYSRKVDSQILDTLSGIAQSGHKCGSDLRLLQHRGEMEEPFAKSQVGSSAMAYKRNPMRAERMCGLARFVMSMTANAAQTEAVQWLERTLDDSVNRRLSLPQSFLGVDAILRLYLNITGGLVVHEEVIAGNVARELPFMATENIIMAAVQAGGDRQEAHELIRQHSHEVAAEVKLGKENDLIARIKRDPLFAKVDFSGVEDASLYVGRSPEQVHEFLAAVIEPIRRRYSHLLNQAAEVRV